jgi:hypothetical protein
VYRIFENESGKAVADLICVHDEVVDQTRPLELFDPEATWKRKIIPIIPQSRCSFHLPGREAGLQKALSGRDTRLVRRPDRSAMGRGQAV